MTLLYQWGSNEKGQLGNGDAINTNVYIPQLAKHLPSDLDINNIEYIYNSSYNSVILTKDNKVVYTVGENQDGQLGMGATGSPNSTFGKPILTDDLLIRKVSIGSNFILLLDYYNKIFGSGRSGQGFPANNAFVNFTQFTEIIHGVPNTLLDIDSGYYHSALLYTDTTNNILKIKTTGDNNFGQLGNNTNTNHPVDFADVVFTDGNPSVYYVSCGNSHTCVLDKDFNVYSTGLNETGQLGLGTTGNVNVFTKVNNSFLQNGEIINLLSCGGYHTCLVTNNNNIYSTGDNDYGQLGLGTTGNVNVFTKVNNSFLQNGESIKQISCSNYNTTLLTSNGRILITGSNSFGQLGNPEDTLSSNKFIEINTTNTANIGFTSISTGCLGQSVFAIKSENPCFSEGTKILCYKQLENSLICILKEEYRLVQHLKIGDLVKSYLHGYRKISKIIKGEFVNNPHTNGCSNCMYRMLKTDDNGLIEDLTLTRNHGVLVEKLTENEEVKVDKNNLLVIDNLLAIITADSDKFEKVMDTNVYKYYHFALETDGDNDRRFGVWANGILVETPSNNMMDGALNIKPLDF
jgi:alpha-tubulin suppressor-like RCC1 family protein